MARWTISDGSEVRSGGKGTGSGPVARDLTEDGVAMEHGSAISVIVVPPPGGAVPLDLESDWLVDVWVRAAAVRFSETVESDYKPRAADVPPEVRKLRRERARGPKMPPGTVY